MLRKIVFVFSLLAVSTLWLSSASPVQAQCATCATSTVAYQPVAYQTYSSGWYPGYYVGRFWNNLWAPRTTYAAYSPVYTASYAPAYTASYAPAYTASYGSSCSSCCSTCYSNPCGCAQQVTLRPACGTCSVCSCDPCGCDTCSTCGVATASYEASGTCPNCASTQGHSTSPPSTFQENSQPTLAPSDDTPTQRTYRPETEETSTDMEPEAAGSSTRSSKYLDFQAPALFNPKDRMTQQERSPVWTAVYQKPVSTVPQSTSFGLSQAQADAAGWNAVQ